MNILIGVDDTPESRQVVERAATMLGPDHHYTIVNVGQQRPLFAAGYPMGSFVSPSELNHQFEIAEDEASRTAKAAASGAAVPDVDTQGIVGSVVPALCEAATEHGADLIVIGSHDRSFFGRLLDPPVGRHLVEEAPCSVLVVR